ncbi:YbiU family protein [Streptomyces sp. NPDC003393]
MPPGVRAWLRSPSDAPFPSGRCAGGVTGRTPCGPTGRFRTFQGWTALSDMDADQGVLHTVPIPEIMAYLLLRPLLPDVPEDSMCGATVNQVFPVTERWHPTLYRALTPIPDVRAGDSVWWHCDMVHSVAPVTGQKDWGDVMYIPAAPWCARNERYAAEVRDAFLTGSSPSDFPGEHYERSRSGRFTIDQLNDTGRRGLGLR